MNSTFCSALNSDPYGYPYGYPSSGPCSDPYSGLGINKSTNKGTNPGTDKGADTTTVPARPDVGTASRASAAVSHPFGLSSGSRRVLGGALVALILSGCGSESGVSVATDNNLNGVAAAVDPGLSWDAELALVDNANVEVLPRAALDKFALPTKGRFFSITTPTGLEVGAPVSIDCGAGEVVAGLTGRAGARLDHLQVLCVGVDGQGDWAGSPQAVSKTIGAAADTTFVSQCPENHAVVGYATDLGATYPTSVALQCRPLTNKNTTAGDVVTLPAVGTPTPPITRSQCASGAVATGLFGHYDASVTQIGLTCFENPSTAGRWSNIFNWPLIAVHSVLRPDGTVLSYGSDTDGNQGAQFNYLVWDPEKGTSSQAFNLLDNALGVDSFCGAATVLPSNGDVMMPGGDARPLGNTSAGISDAVLLGTQSTALSAAAPMNLARWYPTSTVLPSGDLFVVGGIDGRRALAINPEVYSPETGSWQLLPNINFGQYSYFYPRQWSMPDGTVYGLSRNRQYRVSLEGTGAITDLGVLPDYAHGIGTSVMYEPGKILKLGGSGGNGYASALINYNSGTPDIRQGESLAESRRAWPETVIMADGNVMVAGGSLIDNDARTASLGTELFDPTTESFSQLSANKLPRLYHSSALLLKDGRVLLAGGGAPGPLTNLNAELFTPPYLFDEHGNLAERPVLEYAPGRAAYNQTTGLRLASATSVSRITLLKSGSVTHSFNMEQRFLDLDFQQNGDVVQVTMPANARLATPGYYLMFVWNESGVPTEAQIIDLGTVAAPVMPEPPAPPPVQSASNELLSNGSFELEQADWIDCAADELTMATGNAASGSGAIKVSSGGCLYQTVPVVSGASYTLACQAAAGNFDYSSLSLQMLDSAFSELSIASSPVIGADYQGYTNMLEAPEDAVFASVTLYSEGVARFDDCSLLAIETTVPAEPEIDPNAINLLANGDFEQGKSNWIDCAAANLTSVTTDAREGAGALEVGGSGCLYQEFEVSAGSSYALRCSAKSDGVQYSSISLQLTDSFYKVLDVEVLPVGNSRYQSYGKTVLAPFGSSIGAVTLYSEDTAQFDNCRVDAL